MNDIEKQIEDSFKDDSLKKEDDNINNRINHRGNKDKNKKIIYIYIVNRRTYEYSSSHNFYIRNRNTFTFHV